METKSILIGILSFVAGGLVVSIAATTFDKPQLSSSDASHSMNQMVDTLRDKSGDEFDKEFIAQMIVHHQGAIDMAKLSENQAGHTEIKELSEAIVTAQEKEIKEMKQWQRQWGYTEASTHSSH